MSLIKLEKISKDFDKNSVLRDVSLEVRQGEFLCLVGPSGCGKSTLLRLLLGFEKADSGQMSFESKLQKSLVFQNFALFPWLTVEENIGFGLKMAGKTENEIKDKVKEIIAEVGLIGSEKLHPKELSGGMKQRVGLGRALAVEPNILFLDEPFSAVDAFTARDLRKKLLDIWTTRKITIVMVTHLVEEAVELADRVIVLGNDKNKPSVVDTFVNNLARPRSVRSAEFFNKVDELERFLCL